MVQRFGCVRCRKVFKGGAVCKQCGSWMMPIEMQHTVFYALMLVFAFAGLGSVALTVLGIHPIFLFLMFPLIIVGAVFDVLDERMISKKALEKMLGMPPMS